MGILTLEISDDDVRIGDGVEAHIFCCLRCAATKLGRGPYTKALERIGWQHLSLGETHGVICENCEEAMRDVLAV